MKSQPTNKKLIENSQTQQIFGEMLPQREFAILKFEPHNVLLLHAPSKQLYRYQPAPSSAQLRPEVTHPALLRPLAYSNGLLYPRGKSTLAAELAQRSRAHRPLPFAEQEVVNTLAPVAECLAHLHAQGIVHGAVSAHAVVVTQEEEIKLADWHCENPHAVPYYPVGRAASPEDDWAALGQVLIQTATLPRQTRVYTEKDTTAVAQSLLEGYSKGFVFAVCVLLKRNKERYPHLLQYLRNDPKHTGDLELNSLYESLLREKARKRQALTNENALLQSSPPSLKPLSASLHESPVRKAQAPPSLQATLRRGQKEESENKRVGPQEELKKKQIDKINKIIERSNEFVSELMARKNHDQILKKIAPKPNVANLSAYEAPKKPTPAPAASPNKKIRTISRKK